MVAVETRAADNTEEKEKEGRGLRVVQEAMSKLFAYAVKEGRGEDRWNPERCGKGESAAHTRRRRRRKRKRRRRWNDDGGGRESSTMVAMVTPR